MLEIDKARLNLIRTLAERSVAGKIGRTALMKYMYFLQTLRDVPLEYHFSMYSYGPFDSDVLSDLSSAEALGLVSTTYVTYAGGYGYEIRPTASEPSKSKETQQFLTKVQDDIDWLFKQFGSLNSGQLELASTIIFVDQEFSEAGSYDDSEEIIRLVQTIKPHFSLDQVRKSFENLLAKGVLKSVSHNIAA